MRIYFSTVVRGAPVNQGGEVVLLDWDTRRVLQTTPIYPTNPVVEDPNPDGGARGGRGIQLVGEKVVVASYHTLKVFDRELRSCQDVTHPWFAGIHELHLDDDKHLWVASTAIDAALAIDLGSADLCGQFWPREDPVFQEQLHVDALSIDKGKDNRLLFLGRNSTENTGHLHLNAISTFRGDVYALMNNRACVANLSTGQILVRNPALRGAHNLIFDRDGNPTVNDTRGRAVRTFDARTGQLKKSIDVTTFSAIKQMLRRYDSFPYLRRGLRHILPGARKYVRPMWLRGLARVDDLLFVGVSPASIVCIDEATGNLVDVFKYSTDVRACVHGLQVR